jgi:hypothetical protein
MVKAKTEVVSMRVLPKIKELLALAAEMEMRSQANMIEVMVVAYCRSIGVDVEAVLAPKPLDTNRGEVK